MLVSQKWARLRAGWSDYGWRPVWCQTTSLQQQQQQQQRTTKVLFKCYCHLLVLFKSASLFSCSQVRKGA